MAAVVNWILKQRSSCLMYREVQRVISAHERGPFPSFLIPSLVFGWYYSKLTHYIGHMAPQIHLKVYIRRRNSFRRFRILSWWMLQRTNTTYRSYSAEDTCKSVHQAKKKKTHMRHTLVL